MLYLTVALSALVALGSASSNWTVTSEVVFEIDVNDYDGNGRDMEGSVTVGLFGNTAPVSVLNFKTLCSGFKRPKGPVKKHDIFEKHLETISYGGTTCHRIVKDMLLHCGDVFNQEGRGSTSIYGATFNDENFVISHTSGGIVSMANRGKDTNGSQFFFTLGAARFLDGKHVAFGKVTKGYQYLQAVNRIGPDGKGVKPKHDVKIVDCVVKDNVKPYDLSEKDMKTDDMEGIVQL